MDKKVSEFLVAYQKQDQEEHKLDLRKAAEVAFRDAFYQLENGDSIYWQAKADAVWIEKEIAKIIYNKEEKQCKMLLFGDHPDQARVWHEDGDYTNLSGTQWLPQLDGNNRDLTQAAIRILFPNEKLHMFVDE